MAVQYIDDGRTDGSVFGNTSSSTTPKVGFYGATPVVQPALSAFPAVATTGPINSSASATCYGFTSAQCAAIITLLNGLRAQQVTLGLGAT